MSNSNSDRNLLIGVLGLQYGLVSAQQLVAAITAWRGDKSRALEDVLLELKILTEDGCAKLRSIVEMYLQMHGGDVGKSLAALSSVVEVEHDLQEVDDSDLEQSLQHFSQRPDDVDLYRTQSFDNSTASAVGSASSGGVRFRILRPHARGGLGEVSVALDSELNREVALKEIQRKHADQDASRSRFMLEAQITGGLEHPGIVPVYGMGTYADGRPFYAMRFIRGDSLRDGIKKFFLKYSPNFDDAAASSSLQIRLPRAAYESLEFRQLLGRFIDVCNAVAYAHARGVLHRDLKPGNIMLGNYGETLVVDWGLAKATGKVDESLETMQLPLTASTDSASAETMMGCTLGTPAYMSPEQAAGRIDQFSPATDIYCLGATLYHLLTGRPPHITKPDDKPLERIQRGDFPAPRDLNSAIPAPLNSICLKAMATQIEKRYTTGLLLSADVEHWLADERVSAHRDSLVVQLQRWVRRHRTLVTSAAALVLTALVALTISYFALQAEQGRTLTAKKKAEEEGRKSKAAEERERGERTKAEVALGESHRQLARNYFQHGQQEYESARFRAAARDLVRALYYVPDKVVAHAYRRVCIDRAFRGEQLLIPPLVHQDSVNFACFSPDGKRVVTASNDRTARLWNAHTGATIGEPMRHEDSVNFSEFSPDGARIVTSSDDKTARLWDAHTGVFLGVTMQHENGINSAKFSPDGTQIVTADKWNARLWDAQTGVSVGDTMRHSANLKSACFTPDGTRVVTTSDDRTSLFWDSRTGTRLERPMELDGMVHSANFSPDGTHFITSTGIVQLWDAKSGLLLGKQLKPSSTASFATFSPDGMRVVTTNMDLTARVWNVRTGEPISAHMLHKFLIHSTSFSPDATRLVTVSYGGTVHLWDAHSGASLGEPLRHEGNVHSASFSPDGTRLITASDDKTARIWDALPVAALSEPLRHEALVTSASFSPDGSQVLTASRDSTARLWNATTGASQGQPMKHETDVYSASFSPNGKYIVTTSKDQTARLWNANTGESLGEPLRHQSMVNSAFISPDGTRVVTSDEFAAYLWDAQTCARLGKPMRHEGVVKTASFSPDGTRVVSCGRDGRARLWNAQTATPLAALQSDQIFVDSASFSPDGTRLVIGSFKGACVWNPGSNSKSEVLLGKLMQHEEPVRSASFSHDGTQIVTASEDHARLWNAETGASLGEAMRHSLWVRSAIFSPDGERVLTASEDWTARLWDAQTGAAMGQPIRHGSIVRSASFSPDGTRVLTEGTSSIARLWNINRLSELMAADDSDGILLAAFNGIRATSSGELIELSPADHRNATTELLKMNSWQAYLEKVEKQHRLLRRGLATQAELDSDWFAAAWHLERLAKEDLDDAELKQRWENAKQKWAEQKSEWERKAKEQTVPMAAEIEKAAE